MKIAHISDVHIRNHKYHEEQKVVFENLYKMLREIKPDMIVNTGDTAHTKLQLSPAYFSMAANLFENLADIAPYHMILGNHDLNLKNPDKIDAITPIVEALKHPNIHFHKDAGTFDVENFRFHVLSILEEDNWPEPVDQSKVNVSLYHGCVSGVKTDIGFVLHDGDKTTKDFKKFDYSMLGDIHKSNQILDLKGKIRYAGSLCQNNHGETNDKGFLLWDIKDKEHYKVEHHIIPNPKPFLTIELDENGEIPANTSVQEGSRLRIVSDGNLPLDVIRKTVDVAKQKFKPESVTYLKGKNSSNFSIDGDASITDENLRDIKVQEDLIVKYLGDYNVKEETLKEILSLNKKYNSQVEESEEVARNVNWSVKSFKWDNLFNYGGGNSIDFTKLSGVVGIFAKNYAGKSSIIDGLTYTLFNSTSKNERKNYNVINQNKEDGNGELTISIGDGEYKVQRSSDKYKRKLHGEVTEEAKTNVGFSMVDSSGEERNLNGDSRNETDKNITKLFGSMEDFLLTSMASQHGSFNFIAEGSTKRKEILAKFMDLEIFEKKYRFAKEASSNIKGALSRMEDTDFDKEILLAEADHVKNKNETEGHKKRCESLKMSLEGLKEEMTKIDIELSSVPTTYNIDLGQLESEIEKLSNDTKIVINNNRELDLSMEKKRNDLENVVGFMSSWDIDEIKSKKIIFEKKKSELGSLLSEVTDARNKRDNKSKKLQLLKEVPCGDKYPTCKFLQDAYAARNTIEEAKKRLSEKTSQKDALEDQINELSEEDLGGILDNYELLVNQKRDIDKYIASSKIALEKNKSVIVSNRTRLQNLKKRRRDYKENESLNERSKELVELRGATASKADEIVDSLADCENSLSELYRNHGSCEQKVANLKDQKEEFESLNREYSAYDLYMKTMHSNGISYEIIKKRLPVINEEIAKITTNIVDFEVFFEDDGRKLDILIKHPGYEPRPLEMGSGAEKTIGAMAIRLAMTKLSNMPCGDLFILDEPATALDEENMDGFMRIIDMIKTQFKTVILVSHLDALKDCADMTIDIAPRDGFAHVSQ